MDRWEQARAAAHVTAALGALVVGGRRLRGCPKGTTRHRLMGAGYAVLLLAVNVAALSLYQGATRFSVFHVLALISLATLAVGLRALPSRASVAHGSTSSTPTA